MKHVEFSIEQVDAFTIINITGFMDISEVHKFERQIDRLIKNNQLNIILDMTKLTYISSSGLGAMVGYIREVRKRGGDIKIGGISQRVKEILETFGFAAIFDTFLTREEAVVKFKEN